jgi:hypothetical protein
VNNVPWVQLILENIVLWVGLVVGLWEISKIKKTWPKILIFIVTTIAYDTYRGVELSKFEAIKNTKDFYTGLTEDAFENCPECMNKTYAVYLKKKRKGLEIDNSAENVNSPEKIAAGSNAVTGTSK